MRDNRVRRFMLALVAIAMLGAGTTAAYFTDAVGIARTFVFDDAPAPVPAECADLTFAEVIVGTPGDDHLGPVNGGALILGLGGNDTLEGGNGKDCVVGGDGNDTLIGGNGKDVLLGETGDDILAGGGEGDVIDGGEGKDRLDGGIGVDACYGSKNDT